MTTNGKDHLAAALGESYPRVWRGLGLESKTGRNLPNIQDKKRPRADASLPCHLRMNSLQRMRCHRIPTSGFFNVTRFESDLGTVDFAIDLVVAVDEADILGLGAALERASAAAQFEIFDEDDGIAIGQDRAVGILDDAWAVSSRSALP
jgi:hypothetical protein